jgi:hypothetical protein
MILRLDYATCRACHGLKGVPLLVYGKINRRLGSDVTEL